MSKSQRNKGAGGERELCALLTDALGVKVKRLLGQSREGGHDIDLPPFRIEVKRRARIAGFYEWIKQAQYVGTNIFGQDLYDTRIVPIVAARADGKGWLVTMCLDDWIKLAREEISK